MSEIIKDCVIVLNLNLKYFINGDRSCSKSFNWFFNETIGVVKLKKGIKSMEIALFCWKNFKFLF